MWGHFGPYLLQCFFLARSLVFWCIGTFCVYMMVSHGSMGFCPFLFSIFFSFRLNKLHWSFFKFTDVYFSYSNFTLGPMMKLSFFLSCSLTKKIPFGPFFIFVYFWREREHGWEEQREKERTHKQTSHWARTPPPSPVQASISWTGDHDLSWNKQSEAQLAEPPGCPIWSFKKKKIQSTSEPLFIDHYCH